MLVDTPSPPPFESMIIPNDMKGTNREGKGELIVLSAQQS